MSNILVLYKSKYGSTKQYAEWIAADLSADLYEASSFSSGSWEDYSTIVYCGGIYANNINGVKTIIKNQAKLSGKKIIIVACGLSNPNNKELFERIENGLYRKLPQTIKDGVNFFLLRGGVTYSELRFFDDKVLKMLEKMLQSKNPQTLGPEEREMLEVLGKDFSFVDRASIQPIVEYCKAR